MKGSLTDRVHADIKAELTRGAVLPCDRVDVADICERYKVSPSPVRNALNRLVGEGLLETRSHDGFYVPRLTEDGLRDLYVLNELFLLTSLDAAPTETPLPAPPVHLGIVEDTETLFLNLASLSGNHQIRRQMGCLNDHLRAIRHLPDLGWVDRSVELSEIGYACIMQDRSGLARLIRRYHRQRYDLLPRIVALAYTQPRA